jgi:hypothetical protein
MRKVDENRAVNYIKKHRSFKIWLAFALCVSVLTGTLTLYVLNKPATAMTEEGANQIGLVLETADSAFEQELIDQMNDGEDPDSANSSLDSSEESNGDDSGEGESIIWEDIIEEIPKEEADADESGAVSSADSSDEEAALESSLEDAAAEASSEDNADAASSASSDASVDDSSSEGSSTEKKEHKEIKNVLLTANFLDGEGNAIAESETYVVESDANLSQDYKTIEDFFYMNATLDGEKIVALSSKTETVETEEEEASATETSSDEAGASSANEDEEGNTSEYVYYEAQRADGSTFEIREDATITFNYLAANTTENFTFKNNEVTVEVKLSNPKVIPAGTELKVTTVDKKTEGYNYDAYIDALNENAEEIAKANNDANTQKYDEDNTVLFDIAFLLGDVEYEPKDGTVSVSIRFNNNQISEGLGTQESEEVAIVHLPVSEEVMQDVNATSEATDISAKDVSVEVLTESKVDLSTNTDVVSFETDSFSVYGAIRYQSATSWEGSESYGARQIVNMLGDATLFGVVANEYDGYGNHSEANVAVGKIYNVQNFTIGNSTKVYNELDSFKITVTKTVSGSPKQGTFYFALFADEKANQKVYGSDFKITTDYSGVGTYQYDITDIMNKTSFSHIYVYELDGENGKALLNGDTVGNYTVTYGTSSFDGVSDSVSFFSDNYIYDLNGHNPANILQQVPGTAVYFKNGESSYAGVTYNGSGYKTDVYSGSFPVNISDMITNAEMVSQKLAYAKSTNDVLVVNLVATNYGNLKDDLTNLYFESFMGDLPDGYAVNTGFSIGEDTLLLINVDLSNAPNYTFEKFTVNGEGTGDWSKIANQIVLNPIKRNYNGDFVPYDGKFTANIMSGAMIAPKAEVTLTGSYSGTVIADKVNKQCEIHKITVRRFLEAQANVDVYNTSSNAEIIKISADKYVDSKLATAAHTGKFAFTLGMYDPVEKRWKQLDTNIRNEASKINIDLYPEKLGMVYGDGSTADNQKEHTYYFSLSENDPETTEYKIDSSIILIKIKYYKGGEEQPLYYRVTGTEGWDNFLNGTTKYFDDSHRIRSSNDYEAMQKVAFFNTSAETVDVEVTKAWILNGRDESELPKHAKDVVLTLYQTSSGETVKVDQEPEIVREKNPSVDGADFTWKYTWTKLPRFDKNGNRITYTVAETTGVDKFKTDVPETSPKLVVFTTEGEYKNKETGSTYLGRATVTNKGVSLKLQMHKYLDNQEPFEKFDFIIKEVCYDGSKYKWMQFDSNAFTNNGSDLSYTLDPAVWRMSAGNTYYFRVIESMFDWDNNKNNPENSAAYRNYKRDYGAILVKVDYRSEDDIDISYYKVGRDVAKILENNCIKIKDYCTTDNEVTGDKVAFYNSTTDNITIRVTKVWDELVGRAKNDKAVADSIWDVKIVLERSEDGINWEYADEYTIKTPKIWQDYEGADFKGELNDYPEDWTYDAEEGGYVSKTITFPSMSLKYQYRVREYYVDESGNATELTKGGAVVNGFKLESIGTKVDSAGNMDFTVHNTPYIQIYKCWKFNGEEVSYEDTADYQPVYVKLYRNYRADKTYVQMTKDQLLAGNSNAIVHETAENGAIIELNYNNGWYAEFALDRKQDNEDWETHVYQYVYLIKECDENGNDLADSPYITYGSININNVTRTSADYNWDRGFKNKTKSDETHWEDVWVSGNNYPVCILNVTNNRGTNVLPESGGIGDNPFKAVGTALLIIAVLGGAACILFGRRKKAQFLKRKSL